MFVSSTLRTLKVWLIFVFVISLVIPSLFWQSGNYQISLSDALGNIQTKAQSDNGLTKGSFDIYKPSEYAYESEKVMSYSTQEEPAIILSNYKLNGELKLDIYQMDKQDLLDFLVHDTNSNLVNKTNIENFKFLTSIKQEVKYEEKADNRTKITVPANNIGIYFIKAKLQDQAREIVLIRTNLGATLDLGKDFYLFWTQNLSTLRKNNKGTLTTYNLLNQIKIITQNQIDESGIVKIPVVSNLDIALVEVEDDLALVPINLSVVDLNAKYSDRLDENYKYRMQNKQELFHTYTDKPLYKPGDSLYFKSLIRKSNDLNWEIPKGKIKVKIENSSGNQKVKLPIQEYTINTNGTINGKFDLPQNLIPGDYYLILSQINPSNNNEDFDYSSSAHFSLQNYRKPEYELNLKVENDKIITGENIKARVQASYLSGSPASNLKVKLKIYKGNYYGYGDEDSANPAFKYYYPYNLEFPLEEQEIILDQTGQSLINIDTTNFDSQNLDNNQNVNFQKKIYYLIAELQNRTGTSVVANDNILVYPSQIDFESKNSYNASTKLNQPYEQDIKIRPVREEYRSQVTNQAVDVKIKRTWWEEKNNPDQKNSSWGEQSEDLPNQTYTTDQNGQFKFRFTPNKGGSYTVELHAKDINNKPVNHTLNIWVYESKYGYSSVNEKLNIAFDKVEYQPGENAVLNINTPTTPRDALVITGRKNIDSYQVISLNQETTQLDFKANENDIPNTIIEVKSFGSNELDSFRTALKVSYSNRNVDLEIQSDKNVYKPGETVNLKIKTQNQNKDISSEVSVAVVDKAIYELKDSAEENPMDKFYFERWYEILSTNSFDPIYDAQLGGSKTGGGGGGGGISTLRSNFKDLAYWTAEVKTDSKGEAKISFKLPDNLTTWVISSTALAVSSEPKIGQNQIEIKTIQEAAIFPILPNILRIGDDVRVAALIQNNDIKEHEFEVSLEAKDVTLNTGQTKTKVMPGQAQEVSWQIKPLSSNPESSFVFKAISSNNPEVRDSIESKIEITPFGYYQDSYQSLEQAGTLDLKLNKDSNLSQSKIKLNLASSLVSTLPESMDYLIRYPYGCSEQTTSKLAPILIAKNNPKLYPNVFKNQNSDELITKGLENLAELRAMDGGWSFWNNEASDPFITAYVTEYMIEGLKYKPELLYRFRNDVQLDVYLSNVMFEQNKKQEKDMDKIIPVIYTYQLLDKDQFNLQDDELKYQKAKITNFSNLDADLLSLAVIVNVKSGDFNSKTNGLDELIKKGKILGDTLYWDAGSDVRFGSREASTAMAIKAILMAKGPRDIATKGVKYLQLNRKNGYYQNTFATSWAVSALTEFSKTADEISPNYTYEVLLDGNKISSGKLNNPYQNQMIEIDPKTVKNDGSKLEIKKEGTGQIYSSLILNDFRTDSDVKPVANNIKLERSYINPKGENEPFKIGDTVRVMFKVSGLSNSANYVLLEDELPSGMAPLNYALDNEKFSYLPLLGNSNNYNSELIINKNGAWINIQSLEPGTSYFSYDAKVISNGEFKAPPAKINLMYNPSINASTESAIFKSNESGFINTSFNTEINKPILNSTTSNSEIEFPSIFRESNQTSQAPYSTIWLSLSFLLFSLILLVIGFGVYFAKKRKLNSVKEVMLNLRHEFEKYNKRQNDQNTTNFNPFKSLLSSEQIKKIVKKDKVVPLVHPTENDVRHLPDKDQNRD